MRGDIFDKDGLRSMIDLEKRLGKKKYALSAADIRAAYHIMAGNIRSNKDAPLTKDQSLQLEQRLLKWVETQELKRKQWRLVKLNEIAESTEDGKRIKPKAISPALAEKLERLGIVKEEFEEMIRNGALAVAEKPQEIRLSAMTLTPEQRATEISRRLSIEATQRLPDSEFIFPTQRGQGRTQAGDNITRNFYEYKGKLTDDNGIKLETFKKWDSADDLAMQYYRLETYGTGTGKPREVDWFILDEPIVAEQIRRIAKVTRETYPNLKDNRARIHQAVKDIMKSGDEALQNKILDIININAFAKFREAAVRYEYSLHKGRTKQESLDKAEAENQITRGMKHILVENEATALNRFIEGVATGKSYEPADRIISKRQAPDEVVNEIYTDIGTIQKVQAGQVERYMNAIANVSQLRLDNKGAKIVEKLVRVAPNVFTATNARSWGAESDVVKGIARTISFNNLSLRDGITPTTIESYNRVWENEALKVIHSTGEAYKLWNDVEVRQGIDKAEQMTEWEFKRSLGGLIQRWAAMQVNDKADLKRQYDAYNARMKFDGTDEEFAKQYNFDVEVSLPTADDIRKLVVGEGKDTEALEWWGIIEEPIRKAIALESEIAIHTERSGLVAGTGETIQGSIMNFYNSDFLRKNKELFFKEHERHIERLHKEALRVQALSPQERSALFQSNKFKKSDPMRKLYTEDGIKVYAELNTEAVRRVFIDNAYDHLARQDRTPHKYNVKIEGKTPRSRRGDTDIKWIPLDYDSNKKYLNNDIEAMLKGSVRKTMLDSLMYERLGTTDIMELEPIIKADYDRIIAERTDGLEPEQAEKVRKKLEKERRDMVENLVQMTDNLRGNFDKYGKTTQRTIENALMTFNNITLLGNVVVTSATDLFKMMGATHGWRVWETSALAIGKEIRQATNKELMNMGVAMETVSNSRANSYIGIDGFSLDESAIARTTGRVNQLAFRAFLLTPWNQFVKQWTGRMVLFNMMDAITKIADGKKIDAKDSQWLADRGISTDDAKMMVEIMRSGDDMMKVVGKEKSQVIIPQTENWANYAPNKAEGRRLRDLMKATISEHVNHIIITPTPNQIPQWMSKPGWRVIGQYRSFTGQSLISTNLALLQKGDAQAYLGMLGMFGVGVTRYLLDDALYGRDSFRGGATQTAKRLAIGGFSHSGLSWALFDLNNVIESFSGGQVGLDRLAQPEKRLAFRTGAAVGSILGVSATRIFADVPQVISGSLAAIGEDEISNATVGAIWRNVPGQNFFRWRQMLSTAGWEHKALANVNKNRSSAVGLR